MSVKNCALCLTEVDPENAEILTMGAYGTPKLLCENCSCEMDKVTRGREYSEIKEAMDNLTRKIGKANIDDRRVLDTVNEIFDTAAVRANKIKEGIYDFALDEVLEEDVPYDVPEELLETEEDRLLDEKEAATAKKWDKILNWISLGVILAAVGFVVYYFIS